MSNLAIQVENLAKRYWIGRSPEQTVRSKSLLERLASPFNYLASSLREASPDEVIWALQGVSFEVEHGEVLGLIGHNGAGKSTLLKILTRITEPTSGRALVNGRVGSLLEVGTGFHPELTGRENIFLNGAILGMKREEIDRKFDEIVAFAETERFLDTPVKRYSSGMKVRLAFAVAAHLEPEILLIDEVLAVGDAAFQKKCLGKMGDVASQGRTVLFVSHNMVAVQNLCERAILLNNGEIADEGPVEKVLSKYLRSPSEVMQNEAVWPEIESAPGDDKVRIHRIAVCTKPTSESNVISMETPFSVEVEYWNFLPDAQLHVTFHFYTEQHIIAFTTASIETDPLASEEKMPAGLIRSVCHVPGNLLNKGVYRLLVLIVQDTSRIIFKQEDLLTFEVLEMKSRQGAWYGKEPGALHPILNWTTEYLGE